ACGVWERIERANPTSLERRQSKLRFRPRNRGTDATMTHVCLGPTGSFGTYAWCNGATSYSNNQTQTQIRNLLIDGSNNNRNVSGLVNDTGEEFSGAYGVTILSHSNDYGTTGSNGTGATNALRNGNPNKGNITENAGYGDIQIEYGSNCKATAIPLLNYNDAILYGGHITINNIGSSSG